MTTLNCGVGFRAEGVRNLAVERAKIGLGDRPQTLDITLDQCGLLPPLAFPDAVPPPLAFPWLRFRVWIRGPVSPRSQLETRIFPLNPAPICPLCIHLVYA